MSKHTPLRIKNSKGFFENIGVEFRLVLRLIADRQVPLLLKVIPFLGLFYLILPTDLLPFMPFDDALLVWLSTQIFIELCPPEVVSRHRAELEKIFEVKIRPAANQEIVDAEFKVSDDDQK
jgi:hypothetical protein